MKYDSHDFYCCKCGRKGIPVQRPRNQKREKLHKKRLFCLTCGGVVNHVEVTNEKELQKFKIAFERGDYKDEDIVLNGGDPWQW